MDAREDVVLVVGAVTFDLYVVVLGIAGSVELLMLCCVVLL